MPPSAITGIPAGPAVFIALKIAVICGTPTPEMIRVVQIDPGPIPTLTASAPASIKSFTPLGRRNVPATTWISNFFLISKCTVSITLAGVAIAP